MDLHQKLLAIFQTEHAEHVEQIRSIVSLLENVEGAPSRPELNEAFRHAHSLKGAARAVDLYVVEGLAHRLETLLSRVRDGGVRLNRRTAEVIQQTLNCSEDCVASPTGAGMPVGWSEAVGAIDGLLGVVPEAPADPRKTAQPEISFGHTGDLPTPAAPPVETVRVSAENLDRLFCSSGQIIAETPRQNEIARQLAGIGSRLAEAGRVSTSLQDSFELSKRISSLQMEIRAVAAAQTQSAWALRNRAEQLQEYIWQARIMPVEILFEGFRKMVRDLARDQKKRIQFRLSGAEIRADRVVLQALKDPIMHLLRNAAGHGIETPEEREGKGKSPEGLIAVHVALEGKRLIVAVEDDGRGLDFEAVARVAAQKGILSGREAARLSTDELSQLIFQPGFSTSPAVTELSGRGIGLSVVHETVRRLQGIVDFQPRQGYGVRIVLSAPLSASTTHLLLVSCQGQEFGLPTHGVERLHQVETSRMELAQGKPLLSVRGRQIPLFDLSALLGLARSESQSRADVLSVVVLKSGERSAAVAVDSFCGEHHAYVQELGLRALSQSIAVAGGAVRDNGAVSIVLNPAGLIEMCCRAEAPSFGTAKPVPETAPASILVVDDSITTRSLEKGILEAYGYNVRVAVDGLQALELLRETRADLVLSDVEMPRMDGFGLLAALKADKDLKDIPVILVTSRDDARDQRRGLELGAGAYIVKRKFEQRELLRVIEQAL